MWHVVVRVWVFWIRSSSTSIELGFLNLTLRLKRWDVMSLCLQLRNREDGESIWGVRVCYLGLETGKGRGKKRLSFGVHRVIRTYTWKTFLGILKCCWSFLHNLFIYAWKDLINTVNIKKRHLVQRLKCFFSKSKILQHAFTLTHPNRIKNFRLLFSLSYVSICLPSIFLSHTVVLHPPTKIAVLYV